LEGANFNRDADASRFTSRAAMQSLENVAVNQIIKIRESIGSMKN
jgi:hypothetical protein